MLDLIKNNSTLRILTILALSLLIAIVIGIIILRISFEIIIHYMPSEIILENGETFHGQPFAQFFMSVAIGFIFFFFSAILAFVRLEKRILK